MFRDHITGIQDFGFPVTGGEDVFNDDAPAAGAVHAENAFRSAFYHHGNMLDVAAAAKENEVAGQYVIEGNAFALAGLGSRAGGGFDTEFVEDEAGKARTIETGFRADSGVAVFQTREILGVARNKFAELHHFGAFCT